MSRKWPEHKPPTLLPRISALDKEPSSLKRPGRVPTHLRAVGSSVRPWNPSNKPVRAPGWHSLEHVTLALRFLSSNKINKKNPKQKQTTKKPSLPHRPVGRMGSPPSRRSEAGFSQPCRILYSRSHPRCGPVGCPQCPPPPLEWEPM